jgi:hypothetical protein
MRTRVLLACLVTLFLALSATLAAQGRWRDVSPLQSPSPRMRPAMAWDSGRKRVVLFGGYIRVGTQEQWMNDTWE